MQTTLTEEEKEKARKIEEHYGTINIAFDLEGKGAIIFQTDSLFPIAFQKDLKEAGFVTDEDRIRNGKLEKSVIPLRMDVQKEYKLTSAFEG